MAEHRTLYLAWQDAETRRWFPIGRLRKLPESLYEFVYIKGFNDAHRIAGMDPILGFTDPGQRYLSDQLFPHFQNRIMSPSREEYEAYIRHLGFDSAPKEPFEILARSEARRATDSLLVFQAPREERDVSGARHYVIHFFIHGMRHVHQYAQALNCPPGTPLFLMSDWQNPQDRHAQMLRTDDNYLLGWLPRYYCGDVLALKDAEQPITVTVERMNGRPMPSWMRMLCRLSAPWPDGFRAFAAPEYEPLVQ